jgi:thiamine pyrophosphokinase
MTGTARGITIRNAKFEIEDAEIKSDYQYAVSNEVLPGETAVITIREGRLLLVRRVPEPYY